MPMFNLFTPYQDPEVARLKKDVAYWEKEAGKCRNDLAREAAAHNGTLRDLSNTGMALEAAMEALATKESVSDFLNDEIAGRDDIIRKQETENEWLTIEHRRARESVDTLRELRKFDNQLIQRLRDALLRHVTTGQLAAIEKGE